MRFEPKPVNPEPETPPVPLTPEERERRYEELRQRSANSRIYVEPRDPNIAVRWVRNDPHDISLHEWMGFKFAKDNPKLPKEQRRFQTTVQLREDGTYILGDVILMEIARDDYEFYINEGIQRSRDLVHAGKRAFRTEAAKLDVPTFERDKAGNIVR